MPKFKVWDENSSKDDADIYEVWDVEAAAVAFAEVDVDGQADGIYNNGHEIEVEDEAGIVVTVMVTVEWTPEFYPYIMAPRPLPARETPTG